MLFRAPLVVFAAIALGAVTSTLAAPVVQARTNELAERGELFVRAQPDSKASPSFLKRLRKSMSVRKTVVYHEDKPPLPEIWVHTPENAQSPSTVHPPDYSLLPHGDVRSGVLIDPTHLAPPPPPPKPKKVRPSRKSSYPPQLPRRPPPPFPKLKLW